MWRSFSVRASSDVPPKCCMEPGKVIVFSAALVYDINNVQMQVLARSNAFRLFIERLPRLQKNKNKSVFFNALIGHTRANNNNNKKPYMDQANKLMQLIKHNVFIGTHHRDQYPLNMVCSNGHNSAPVPTVA